MTGADRKDPAAWGGVDIVETTTPFRRFLRVDTIRFRHRLFSGEWSAVHTCDVMRRGAAVGIVLYDPERDAVVLIEQFRLAAMLAGGSAYQLEIVAGLVGPDEPPEAVAIRETKEETGLVLEGELIPIQRYLPSCGASDESVALYCAPVDASRAGGVHGAADEGEDIRTVVKTLAEIEALIEAGAIENGHSLIGLYWLLRHREELRRRLARSASSPPPAAPAR